jgi:sec-independent protein translocase protein TatB
MEILGVGPSELIFIIIIALIVLGPKDMQKAGKTIGQYLNKLVRSDGWKAFQQTSRELRNLPTNLMREANLDLADAEKDIRKSMDTRTMPPGSTSSRSLPQSRGMDNTIQPPSATPASAASEPASSGDTPINSPEDDLSKPNQNA